MVVDPSNANKSDLMEKVEPSEEELEQDYSINLANGKKNLLCNDFTEAVACFQVACSVQSERFGDTSPECAEAFFYYGKGLLELARVENGVLGNALKGVPETEDSNSEEDDQFETAKELPADERLQLRQDVEDAMAEFSDDMPEDVVEIQKKDPYNDNEQKEVVVSSMEEGYSQKEGDTPEDTADCNVVKHTKNCDSREKAGASEKMYDDAPQENVKTQHVSDVHVEVGFDQKEASEAPREIGKAPKEVSEPPEKVGEAPMEVSEAPEKVGEAPMEVGEASKEVIETPREVSETPKEVCETPKEVCETPKEIGETPKEIGETPKEIGETPKEVVEAPKEIGEATKDVGEATKEVGEATKEVGEATKEVGEATKEVCEAPKEVGEAPEEFGEATEEVGEAPEEVGEAPEEVGEAPEEVGEAPEEVGEAPEEVGEAPEEVGEASKEVGETPREVVETPREVVEAPKKVGEATKEVDEATKEVCEASKEVVKAIKEVCEAPREVSEAPKEVGEAPKEVGEAPREVGEAPREVGEAPREVGEAPREVGEAPREVGEAPREVGEAPMEVGEAPKEVLKTLKVVTDTQKKVGETLIEVDEIPKEVTETLKDHDETSKEVIDIKKENVAAPSHNQGQTINVQNSLGITQKTVADTHEQHGNKPMKVTVTTMEEVGETKKEVGDNKTEKDDTLIEVSYAQKETKTFQMEVSVTYEEDVCLPLNKVDSEKKIDILNTSDNLRGKGDSIQQYKCQTHKGNDNVDKGDNGMEIAENGLSKSLREATNRFIKSGHFTKHETKASRTLFDIKEECVTNADEVTKTKGGEQSDSKDTIEISNLEEKTTENKSPSEVDNEQPSTSSAKKADDDDEETTEDPDDIPNMQLAWEMLELAKVLYGKKSPSDESKLMIAQCHLKLGELGLEIENYSQGIEDFLQSLSINEKILSPHDRRLAETHYSLGLAYSFTKQYDDAVKHYKAALFVLESRIDFLNKSIDSKDCNEDADGDVMEECAEVGELKNLIPDINSKIEDVMITKRQDRLLLGATLTQFGETSSPFGTTSQDSSTVCTVIPVRKPENTSSAESNIQKSDISHLVRRKRPVAEEKDVASKRVKQDYEAVAAKTNDNGVSTENTNKISKSETDANLTTEAAPQNVISTAKEDQLLKLEE